MNIALPDIDGKELISRIKQDPAIANLHLIACVPFGKGASTEQGSLAGLATCLTKPIRPSHLSDCVQTFLTLKSTTMPEATPTAVSASTPAPEMRPPSRIIRHSPQNLGRILVAEDNSVNQRVAIRMLEKLGYRADAVANGS